MVERSERLRATDPSGPDSPDFGRYLRNAETSPERSVLSFLRREKAGEPQSEASASIERQRDAGKSDKDIWLDAIRNGDLGIVASFVRDKPKGFDIDWKGEDGRSALHAAVAKGDIETVKLLVDTGRIDMAALDENGDSAFDLAASDDRQDIKDFLKEKLSGEARAAYDNGDVKRIEALVEAGADDSRPPVQSETLSADMKRPPGDERSAADIIRDNPTLANLSSVDKEFLKHGYSEDYAKRTFGSDFDVTFKGVGDFETDPDAAYRAAKIMEHIEHFDENGEAITGDGVGDGRIDGWTATRTNPRTGKINPNSEAEHGTEAGRFQDFVKYGFSLLKGEADPFVPPIPNELADYQPLIDRLDFRNDETTEEVDGQKLTVQQLALKNLLTDYQKKIESGEIKEGSAEYKLYYALQAQGDIANGRTLETHFEQQWQGTGGSTTRDLGEDKAPASAEDMSEIIDGDKVAAAIDEAFSDPKVAEAFNGKIIEAAAKVPGLNLERTQAELRTLIASDGYLQHFMALQKTDPDKANAEFQQLFASYSVLAGTDGANALAAEVARGGMAQQLDDTLADPDAIDPEYWLAATNDFVTNALGAAIASGAFTNATLSELRDPKLLELLKNKDFQSGLADIVKKYLNITADGGQLTEEQMRQMNKDINANADRVFGAEADRTAVKDAFGAMARGGFLNSAVGFISLASGIRRMVNNEGFTDDPLQNLAMVNSFMVYLGTIDEQVKFADIALRHTNISRMLHLGNTADLFGATTLKDVYNVGPNNVWKDQIDRALKQADSNPPKLGNGSSVPEGIVKDLARKFGGPDAPATDLKLKTAVSALRVIAGVANVGFGILAAVSGGLGLAKADNAGDKAVAGLNLAAGVAFTGSGAAQTAALFGVRAAAPWIARLSFVGIFLSVIGLVVAEVLTEKKENKVQVDYFDNLKKLGLLGEEWGDKLEFLTLYGYDRDLPEAGDGKSVFDTYDWKQWLADYRKDNEGNYSTSPHVPDLHFNQDAENTLNAIVSIYGEGQGEGEGINFDRRQVPSLGGDLEAKVRDLVTFYLQNIDSNDTAEEAADWAVEQIRDRLGVAYDSGGDARKALDVLDGWLDRHDGRQEIQSLAQDVIDDLGLKPDPNENEQKPEREGNGIDWSKVK